MAGSYQNLKSLNQHKGAITLNFVFVLPALLGMLAISTMIAMHIIALGRAAQASDAASLACAYEQKVNPVVIDGFLDYYRPGFVSEAETDFSQLTLDKSCRVVTRYRFKTHLSALLPGKSASMEPVSDGKASARLVLEAESVPTDLALVLDISGSMSSRLGRLKSIITDAIENIQAEETENSIRFSIVPFQSGVSVKDAPWFTKSNGKVMCVDGMSYSSGSVDPRKTVEELGELPSNLDIREVEGSQWLASCSVAAPMMPLNADLNQVMQKVKSLETSGGTASYQGLIWGVRTLLPQWQQEWAVEPVENTKLVQRLVLFTDGADQNSYFDALVDENLCKVIQDEYGIEMTFIGFGVDHNRLEQFRRCAGSSGFVYDAQNTEELEKFFQKALQTETTGKLVLGQ